MEDYDDVAGHALGRRGHELRADAHARRADRVRQGRTCGLQQQDVDRSPKARFQRRHDQRARRVPGPQHAGANRGRHPGVGNRLRQAANQLCILLGMPPEDLQARLGPASIPTAPPEVAVGIPADLLAPPARRSPRRTAGGRPECPDRHRRGRFLSRHLDQRHDRLLGRRTSPTCSAPRRSTGNVGPSFHLEHSQLRPDPEQRAPPGRPFPGVGDHLPADGAQRRSGRGERAGDVPARPAAHEVRRRPAWPTPRRPCDIVLAQYEAGTTDFTRVTLLEQNLVPLAGHAGAGPGRNRHGPDPGLSGPGRRLGDPLHGLRAEAIDDGNQGSGSDSGSEPLISASVTSPQNPPAKPQ